jgi:hypothetical protein
VVFVLFIEEVTFRFSPSPKEATAQRKLLLIIQRKFMAKEE